MKRAEVLQEVRMMRFEEAYYGWQEQRLTQTSLLPNLYLLNTVTVHYPKVE